MHPLHTVHTAHTVHARPTSHTRARALSIPLQYVGGGEAAPGQGTGYAEYGRHEVLQMVGRAGRPQFDTEVRHCFALHIWAAKQRVQNASKCVLDLCSNVLHGHTPLNQLAQRARPKIFLQIHTLPRLPTPRTPHPPTPQSPYCATRP